ncbi:hypothetical protein B0H13DRAFT_2351581 [Mycena leptocephala]|nr:hypothetical protein B0H13DRAFT_2351581 [Mycena leptocephala]
MHTASTAHASTFPQPSRTIFALVVQACFPSPYPRTRSTCSSLGARALMHDLPLTARRYPRRCMLLDLTPLSLRVRSALRNAMGNRDPFLKSILYVHLQHVESSTPFDTSSL